MNILFGIFVLLLVAYRVEKLNCPVLFRRRWEREPEKCKHRTDLHHGDLGQPFPSIKFMHTVLANPGTATA